MSNGTNRPVECDNCDWTGTDENIKPWYYCDDIAERLSPGGTIPAGECPKCGAFAYYTDEPDTVSLKKSIKEWRDLANNAVDCLESIRNNGQHTVWREIAEIIEDRSVLINS